MKTWIVQNDVTGETGTVDAIEQSVAIEKWIADNHITAVANDLNRSDFSAVPIAARLEYLRGEIRAEHISYSELAELQGMAEHIDRGDVELREWAGIPEGEES